MFDSGVAFTDIAFGPGLLQCSVDNSELYVHIECEPIPHASTFCSFDGGPTHKCEMYTHNMQKLKCLEFTFLL